MKHFYWEDLVLYKHYADQLIIRCVPENEMQAILWIMEDTLEEVKQPQKCCSVVSTSPTCSRMLIHS